jgi:predicted nucleic acid-binding protein
MTVPVFVDTNVLAYSRDSGYAGKQLRATEWLAGVGQSGVPRTSFQVLVELYNTLTRRLGTPVAPADARALVLSLLDWKPIGASQQLLAAAWDVQDHYGLSWWDAQVVAAAQLQGCVYLLTEDLQHGQKYGPVEVLSPFEITAEEVFGR